MMEQWARIGVEVHILNFMGGSAVDFSSPVGKLCVSMLAVIAEFERDLTRERTKEAAAYARRHGGGGGQPRCGFRHVKVEINGVMKRRQSPDPEERKQMREILRLRTEDPRWSWDEIRQEFNYSSQMVSHQEMGEEHQRQGSGPRLLLCGPAKQRSFLQHREAMSNRGEATVSEARVAEIDAPLESAWRTDVRPQRQQRRRLPVRPARAFRPYPHGLFLRLVAWPSQGGASDAARQEGPRHDPVERAQHAVPESAPRLLGPALR